MRVEALEAFDIDEQVVDSWKSNGHEKLLPVQQLAVKEHRVLDGGNVLVVSPTSSGKTFVGEMAAVKTAGKNRRVIYLVPQKALAEEKYRTFRKKYAGLGIRTVISTRDRREFDGDINGGRFHVAVVVFEKMQSLLVANPSMLERVGLVVFDELQMIGDKGRGAGIEILLTKIKTSPGNPQMVALSAALGNGEEIAEWLGATLCCTRRRPVELRKGILLGGKFYYVEHNSGGKGVEEFGDQGFTAEDALMERVRSFAESGEQSLVFLSAKKECMALARSIAKKMDGAVRPAEKALAELEDLEDTEGKDVLKGLLAKGIAYHNAGLDREQRDLVERHFRSGDITIVCSTSTLALGMNMPAKNVFVCSEKWQPGSTGRWMTVPVEQAEFENMGGRAGRLGLAEDFGRAVIVTDSKFDARTYYQLYVKGESEDVEPTLDEAPLSQHVLNLVASGLCDSRNGLRDFLLSSFTGEKKWKGQADEFDRRLENAVGICIHGDLMEKSAGGVLEATDLGKAAAVKGITVDTAIKLALFARRHKDGEERVHLLDVLAVLNRTEDGTEVYFNLSTREHESGMYLELLRERAQSLPEERRKHYEGVLRRPRLDYECTRKVKKTLILQDWVTGVPTREIEKRFCCYAGSIAGLAVEFSWLAEALCAIARVCGWSDERADRLQTLSERLIYGVTENGIEIARTRVRGLGRSRIHALVRDGVCSLEQVVDIPPETLAGLVTGPVAERLAAHAAEGLRRRELLEEKAAGEEATQTSEEETVQAEWEPEFPRSDDLGMSYQSDAKVHIDGRERNRRRLVVVDGKEAWLTDRSFETIMRLAIAARDTELGWVSAGEIGQHDTYHQVIRRLRADLPDGMHLIENNKTKQYRLSIPPANVLVGKAALDVQHIGKSKSTECKYEKADGE